MKQKMKRRRHTTKSRKLNLAVNDLKQKQKRLRNKWITLDIIITALEMQINKEVLELSLRKRRGLRR